MSNKIQQSINLLSNNFRLFSQIILTVWLPASILLVFLRYAVFPDLADYNEVRAFTMELRVTNLIEIAFSPLYGGALIYALSRIKQGFDVTYKEAMTYASKRSFKLLATRFRTGLFVVLGFIAFIIPGIVLGLRFALVDEAVVLDDASGSTARKLSTKLTKGKKGKIFSTSIIAFIMIALFSVLSSFSLSLPLMIFGVERNFFLDVIDGCISSIIGSTFYIVFFLFYWESKKRSDRLEEKIHE